jgi:hypothetical protein
MSDRRASTRRVVAVVLVVLFSITVVATTIGVWTRRTLLETEQFVEAVGPVPENDEVRIALAAFLTNELFGVLDLEAQAEDILPSRLDAIVPAVAEAARGFVQDRVEAVLESPQFNEIWRSAVAVAHSNAVKVLRGDADAVTTEDGRVVLDLVPVLQEVLNDLVGELPAFVGNLADELPEDIGLITVFDEDELSEAQAVLRVADQLLVALLVATVVLGVAAVFVSVNRRRTLLQLGLGTAIGIFAVFTVLRRVIADLVDLIPEGQNRDAVRAAAKIVAQGLRDEARVVLLVGLIVAVAAYLAGPGRGAVGARQLVRAPGRRWAVDHVDGLRVGGAAIAVAVLLLADLSWVVLLLIAVALVGYEIALSVLANSIRTDARLP